MREYIRFVMRSREGLYAYLRFLLIALGAVFAIYMVWLGILIHEGYNDVIFGSMRYAKLAVVAGGIACFVMTGRMMRISVSSGVSRKGFLRGHILMMLLFALVTSAAIILIFVITDAVYHLFGLEFVAFETQLFPSNEYQPRIIAYNLANLFSQELFLYSIALLMFGFRKRFRLRIGLMPVFLAVCFFFVSPYGMRILYQEDLLGYIWNNPLMQYILTLREPVEWWMDIKTVADFSNTDVADMAQRIGPDRFWICLLQLAGCAVTLYLLCSGVFGLLTARVPVRGKEQEG